MSSRPALATQDSVSEKQNEQKAPYKNKTKQTPPPTHTDFLEDKAH
jgi:hypothetical protein